MPGGGASGRLVVVFVIVCTQLLYTTHPYSHRVLIQNYPLATFASTDVQGIPESYTEGQEITFKLTGDMTIREVTKPVTFDVRGKLEGDTITGTATTQLLMKDFGFDPPSIAGMLTVQDGVTVTVNFTAKESS